MPNYYDRASRYAAKLDPPGFLGWLLGLPAATLEFRGWLDTCDVPFPGNPDRTGDTVAHLENVAEHGVPWALAVEFQTVPDSEMFGRLMGYLSGLWLTLRPDAERGSRFSVGATVVNLTGGGVASRSMRWPGTGLATQLDIVERNLESESAAELLSEIEKGRWSRCLLPWISLMACADDPSVIDQWKRLAETEPNSRRRADYAAIALVFAARVGRKDLWQTQLEGWNVEESPVVNEWFATATARAEARGEAHGRMEATRSLLLDLGRERFGPASTITEAAILAITDSNRLAQLVKRVLQTADWNDLLATP
ncbi:MAG: hypothetical protein K8U57_21950 [Planctomycetes bacterium]|nr:hypothetical protein [Planctomycetota bacterium]